MTSADAAADVGYMRQRPDLAAQALLAEYPLQLGGGAPAPETRAIVYTSPSGVAWSPIERRRSKDPQSLYVAPVGLLMQRYGLEAARDWLPLCVALLRGESRWVPLGGDLGHVEIAAGHVRGVTLHRTITSAAVDIGLHAARLGGAQTLPVDSPLFAFASPRGVGEHLRVRDVPEADWVSADGRIPFEPIVQAPPPPPDSEAPMWPARPGSKRVPPRMLALWDYLADHRYGFDMLHTGEGAPVVDRVTIVLPTATILAQWTRLATDDPAWRDLCTAATLDPRLALPWVFRITRYLHAFVEDQPAYAAAETERDADAITETLTLAKKRMMIISFFRDVLV